MFRQEKFAIIGCTLYLIAFILFFSPTTFAQDETSDVKIIERYKLMLSRNPKEGSTFDRLYQFYLEGAGLDAMVSDYEAAAEDQTHRSEPPTHLGTYP